jgi:hypothetical protein
MPKIIVEADSLPGAGPARATLTEWLVAAHLSDDHYATALMQRIGWAAVDAELLERRDGAGPAGTSHPAGRCR